MELIQRNVMSYNDDGMKRWRSGELMSEICIQCGFNNERNRFYVNDFMQQFFDNKFRYSE